MKKTLVGLFSKNKPTSKTQEKDAGKSAEQKKKFKFRTLSKSSLARSTTCVADSASKEEISNSDFTENEPRPSLYATVPSSKSKSFSFSELDLRKPKSLRNYNFGLRKRLKKDDNKISKSTIGLPGMGAQQEEQLDSSHLNMDHVDTNLSSSQPLLLTTNKTRSPLHSAFSLNQQQTSNSLLMQPQSQEIIDFDSSEMLDVDKAPIATISELEDIAEPWRKSALGQGGASEYESRRLFQKAAELDKTSYSDLVPQRSEEMVSNSLTDSALSDHLHDAAELSTHGPTNRSPQGLSKSSLTEISSASIAAEDESSSSNESPESNPDASSVSQQESSTQPGSSEKTKDISDVQVSDSDSHSEIQCVVNNGTSETVQPENTGLSLPSDGVVSQTHSRDSVDYSDRKMRPGQVSPTKTSAVIIKSTLLRPEEKPHRPIIREFSTTDPLSYKRPTALDIMDSGMVLPNKTKVQSTFERSYQVFNSSKGPVNTADQWRPKLSSRDKSEYDPLKVNSYTYPTTSRGFSRTPLSPQKYDTIDTTGSKNSPKDKSDSVMSSRVYAFKAQSDQQDNTSQAEIKGSTGVFCDDPGRSGAPHSAPPVSEYSTSQGTETRVSPTKQRAVVVKESVSDRASMDPSLPSDAPSLISLPEKMNPVRDFDVKSDTSDTESFYSLCPLPEEKDEHKAVTNRSEEACSPMFLSVGSDEGSILDVYYSADEDNVDGHPEAVENQDTKEEKPSPRQSPIATSETVEDQSLLALGGAEISQILSSDDQVKPAVKVKQTEVNGKQEVLARLVPQGNTLLVCDSPPPSGKPHVLDFDRNNIKKKESIEPTHKLDSLIKYYESNCAKSNHARKVYVKQDSATRHRDEENAVVTVVKFAYTSPPAEVLTVTHSAELQSDATVSADNRAAPRSSKWEDTITHNSDTNRTTQEQVAVTASDPHQKTAAVPGDPITPGFASAADEVGFPETVKSKVHNMNSGYSSLSTTLSIKALTHPNEEEPKHRVKKVSLVRTPEEDKHTVDFLKDSEYNSKEMGVSSDYKWESRFDSGKLHTSDSHSDSSSDFSTSALAPSQVNPEATAYRLSDRLDSYTSHEGLSTGEPRDEWRRSYVWEEESAAPAGEIALQKEGETERERFNSSSQGDFAVSASFTDHPKEDSEDSSFYTGVFKAQFVDLVDPAASGPSSPIPPDTESSEMESLVDTLKNMGPSQRLRNINQRMSPHVLVSSLSPIVEDAAGHSAPDQTDSIPTKPLSPVSDSLNGIYTLPPGIGLKKTNLRDSTSPLALLKGVSGQNLSPLRTPTNLLKSPDSSLDNINGNVTFPNTTSRLENSLVFGSFRSSSVDQMNDNAHRPLFRARSLPDYGSERVSGLPKELGDSGPGVEPVASRFERISFLSNSLSGSLNGSEEHSARMSRPPPISVNLSPTSNSPNRILSPTGSIDLQRPFPTTDFSLPVFNQTPGIGMGVPPSPLGNPLLQRSFSQEGIGSIQQNSAFNSMQTEPKSKAEPEKNILAKYRAFPDAYLTKEKEHGKSNPRPGKMYIFDRSGMCGQRIEVRSDVVDATTWELQETISIRVIRGGWVLYEKPNFKGEKIALDEGDTELTFPFAPLEEEKQNGQPESDEHKSEENSEATDVDTKPARKFVVGSLRRAVRDYSVPEISLFPEEDAEGKKVVFRDSSDDARIFGFPIKANSIIIRAGLWLVYAKPFFEGPPRVLEVGGYTNPQAWGVDHPYVGSLHPLKIGEPRVENRSEPKMVVYEKSYFSGKSRTINTNTRDFMTRADRQQTAFMYNVGSLKVLGGIWVGYEKEGFRGHQYLLEEGEYHDWRAWGGCDAEMRSVRVIQADLTDPLMMMFEQPEEEEEGVEGDKTFEVTEAIPDVEPFGFKTSTRSIDVLRGAWIAYSHVDFSGHQYILEKGFYNNCADWGAPDNRICSVQPILLAPADITRGRNEIILYSEPDFQGLCHIYDCNEDCVSDKFLTKSCRVASGSWVLYEEKSFSGNMYVLSEGDYPNLNSMGCPPGKPIRSVKVVPLTFSVPSISLFGLECLEGREITTETEIVSMVGEGFSNHVLSLRVNSGCWVVCEHNNYRGRQFLLEPIEITNWPKFSSLQTIGSMYPIRVKRHFFRIKNTESQHYMSVQGGVGETKTGRVIVSPEIEPMSDIWYYQNGFIKSKLCMDMSLQVMGNLEPGAKVVLWSETRQPLQTWTAQMKGRIVSFTFRGMVLDVKGGKTYDKDHLVIMPENDERPSQQWEIELL
ncbi:uncharacterized protein crybg2 [Synchiropus picturatus]